MNTTQKRGTGPSRAPRVRCRNCHVPHAQRRDGIKLCFNCLACQRRGAVRQVSEAAKAANRATPLDPPGAG